MIDGIMTTLGLLWQARSSFTPRKWRLYACTCARRLPESARSPLRGAIELAERHADGEASDHELAALRFGVRNNPDSPAALLCWSPDSDGWDVVTASYHGDVGAHVAKCLWLFVRMHAHVIEQAKPKKLKKGQITDTPGQDEEYGDWGVAAQ